MKTHIISLINAIILIALSAWGYFTSSSPSFTALIPLIFGVGILLCNNGLRKENKLIAHIAVILTVLVLGGLIIPFVRNLGGEITDALIRISVMILSTLLALIFFIRSFIQARR